MSGMVDSAPFDHHEKLLRAHTHHMVDGGTRHRRQRHIALACLDSVVDAVVVYGVGAEKHHLVGVGLCQFVEPVDYLHVVAVEMRCKTGGLTLLGKSAQACTGNELIPALGSLTAYLVVHAAVGHIGIECRRSGVVGCNVGHKADAIAQLLEITCYRAQCGGV